MFDWIEIGALGRQVAKRHSGPLDRFFNASDFVTGEVIHDHDIALAQGRGEEMLDIGQEACSIYRPIKDTGRGDLILTKRGNECRCHPVAMWGGSDEALAARSTPKEPHQIRFCSSFIDEDKIFRVQIGLACTPFVAGRGDIRAVLLGGAQ